MIFFWGGAGCGIKTSCSKFVLQVCFESIFRKFEFFVKKWYSFYMSEINHIEDNETKKDDSKDEISLIDLFAVLLKYKLLIIIITAVAMIGVVVYAAISLKLPPEKSYMPNVYTAKAQMLINDDKAGGASLGNLSSLASLAGVNVGGGGASNSALASYLVKSNTVQDAVVDKFNFITSFFYRTKAALIIQRN